MLKKLALVLAVFVLLGCSQDRQAPQQSAQSPAGPATAAVDQAGHKLVFFINPDGAPCQMQGKILAGMADELKDKVAVRAVRTTVREDLDIFYAYGIRALPTLLLTDADGNEIDRLPPGVHPAETIRGLVDRIPKG